MQHLRNIILDAMAAAGAAHLKEELADSLEAFSSYERMSTDAMQLVRAAYKEFHHEGDYYKGHGREFEGERAKSFADAFYVLLERAKGGRQVCCLSMCISCRRACAYAVASDCMQHLTAHRSTHVHQMFASHMGHMVHRIWPLMLRCPSS